MKRSLLMLVLVLLIIYAILQALTGCSRTPKTIIGKDGAEMVLIPAGEFQMGSNDGGDNEKPIHTVYLDAFYIDKYEVTNAQYKKFVNATKHSEPVYPIFLGGEYCFGAPNQPVINVSWNDAKDYADWAGKRLPTVEEWEKAARGGLTNKKYVWGDEWPPPKNAGNFADEEADKIYMHLGCISGYNDGYADTAPVGSFQPNGYGLYDMEANVMEWCADCLGAYRLMRGSAFDNAEFHFANDHLNYRIDTYCDVGFRCVQ